jgi:hypothetical protein
LKFCPTMIFRALPIASYSTASNETVLSIPRPTGCPADTCITFLLPVSSMNAVDFPELSMTPFSTSVDSGPICADASWGAGPWAKGLAFSNTANSLGSTAAGRVVGRVDGCVWGASAATLTDRVEGCVVGEALVVGAAAAVDAATKAIIAEAYHLRSKFMAALPMRSLPRFGEALGAQAAQV